MIAVKAPKGAQLLYFPMMDCTISAGFKNAKYKRRYGYQHYGIDFDSKRSVDFEALASGYGTVIGVEMNKNSIGGVTVIRYDNVYCPSDKKIRSLILRKYHSYKILVKKGDKVRPLQPIAIVSGSDKWLHHDHTEIDKDIRYPFHTPQVSEGASKMLIRRGANDKTMLNPLDVLVVHPKQKCKVHSLATCADPINDAPRYYEE